MKGIFFRLIGFINYNLCFCMDLFTVGVVDFVIWFETNVPYMG